MDKTITENSMRILFALIIVYTAIVLYGGVLNAKEASEDPIAVQTTDWNISGLGGATEVSLKPENCLMQTQYDNGVQITFKALGKRLTALRIQSMQGGMNLTNASGFVGLGVGNNSYALQSKTNNGQIDSTLLTVPNLATKLKDATVFRLKLGTQNTYFALQGFADGYHRLMVCMGVMPTKTLQVVDHAKGMPRPSIDAPQIDGYEMPAEPIGVVQMMKLDGVDDGATDMAAIDTKSLDDGSISMPTPITPLPKSEDSVDDKSSKDMLPEWRASKGQKLSSVLIDWADQQGVETQITMDRNPVLSQDILYKGAFEMAVNSLLKETGVDDGISATVKNGDTHIGLGKGTTDNVSVNQGDTPNESINNVRWRALVGTDVRKVLMQWSAKEGVDIIWNAPEFYLVRESVNTTAPFDKAVATLLGQFDGQPTRPVAQLNSDPDTNRVSLIVKTSRTQ